MGNIESILRQIVGFRETQSENNYKLLTANNLGKFRLNIFHIFLVLFYQIPSFISVVE